MSTLMQTNWDNLHAQPWWCTRYAMVREEQGNLEVTQNFFNDRNRYQAVLNLQAMMVTHPNRSIFALVRFQLKPNDRHLRPCNLFDEHSSILFILTATPTPPQQRLRSSRSADTSGVVV